MTFPMGTEKARESSDASTTTQQSSRSPDPEAALEQLKDDRRASEPQAGEKRSLAAVSRRRTGRGRFEGC